MKHVRTIGLLALTAAILLGVTGCGWFAEEVAKSLLSPDGYVYDAKQQTKTGISNVDVNLRDMNGTIVSSASTDSSGYYILDGIDAGTYELTASKSGWAFISRVVVVNGLLETFPNLLGVTATDDISIILTWNEDNVVDLDAKISVPPTVLDNGHGTFSAYGLTGTNGFSPESYSSQRTLVGWDEGAASRTDSHRGVTHDVDAKEANKGTFPRIETITLPLAGLTGTSGTLITDVGDGPTAVIQTGDRWEGILEYSVRGYGSEVISSQGTPKSAEAMVYVLQETNMLGAYPFPIYTDLDHVSVLRIHAFSYNLDADGYYLIYPDLQILTSGWRGLTPTTEYIATARK